MRVIKIQLAIFTKLLAIELIEVTKLLAIVTKLLAIEKKKPLSSPYFIGLDVNKKKSDNIFYKLCLFKYTNMIKKRFLFGWNP